jgi:hypothetical protein
MDIITATLDATQAIKDLGYRVRLRILRLSTFKTFHLDDYWVWVIRAFERKSLVRSRGCGSTVIFYDDTSTSSYKLRPRPYTGKPISRPIARLRSSIA